jgi:hypothetical protein
LPKNGNAGSSYITTFLIEDHSSALWTFETMPLKKARDLFRALNMDIDEDDH